MVCGCLADAPNHWLALHLYVTDFHKTFKSGAKAVHYVFIFVKIKMWMWATRMEGGGGMGSVNRKSWATEKLC